MFKLKRFKIYLISEKNFLKSIQPPFSQQEQELGKQLVELNQQVEQLLQIQKLEIHERYQTASYSKKNQIKNIQILMNH